MNLRLGLRLVSLALFAIAVPALADNINVTFTDGAGSGNLSLTASATFTAGQYLITTASGIVNGLNVVSLVSPGGYPAPSTGDTPNDNLFFYPFSAGTPAFDLAGLAVVLFGGQYFNLYSNSGSYFTISGATPALEGIPVTVSNFAVRQTGSLPTTITPEPATWLLTSVGLVVIKPLRRRMALKS